MNVTAAAAARHLQTGQDGQHGQKRGQFRGGGQFNIYHELWSRFNPSKTWFKYTECASMLIG